jgi:hypothetical protein
MALVYACPSCGDDMLLRPVHRGKTVPCPACGAATEIPDGLAFRHLSDAALADRRTASRQLFWAAVASVLFLPPVTAFVWWRTDGLIRKARDQGRDVVEDLRVARIIAIVGTVAHAARWAQAFI